MLPAVLHVAEKLSGVAAMGFGSMFHGGGLHLCRRFRAAVVLRVVHLQTTREIPCFRIRRRGTYRLWRMESAGLYRNHQFRIGQRSESVLTNGQVGAIALNGAALGFIAFLLAKLLDVKLANRKGMAIAMLIAEIVVGLVGLLIMIRMFSVLY